MGMAIPSGMGARWPDARFTSSTTARIPAPIIGQRAFPILPEDRLEDVKRKGLAEEWALYPESIRLYVEGRLSIAQEVAPRGGGVRKVVRITPS